jgi:hypothetical protein
MSEKNYKGWKRGVQQFDLPACRQVGLSEKTCKAACQLAPALKPPNQRKVQLANWFAARTAANSLKMNFLGPFYAEVCPGFIRLLMPAEQRNGAVVQRWVLLITDGASERTAGPSVVSASHGPSTIPFQKEWPAPFHQAIANASGVGCRVRSCRCSTAGRGSLASRGRATTACEKVLPGCYIN